MLYSCISNYMQKKLNEYNDSAFADFHSYFRKSTFCSRHKTHLLYPWNYNPLEFDKFSAALKTLETQLSADHMYSGRFFFKNF